MHLENAKATYKRRTKAIHQPDNNRNILYNGRFIWQFTVKAQYHL